MSDCDQDEIKKHVKDKDTWLRFVYLVVLGIAYYLTVMVIFVASVLQFFSSLLSGKAFHTVAAFGRNLTAYQNQLSLFLTYASDEKPFPFAPFPCEKTDSSAPTPEA